MTFIYTHRKTNKPPRSRIRGDIAKPLKRNAGIVHGIYKVTVTACKAPKNKHKVMAIFFKNGIPTHSSDYPMSYAEVSAKFEKYINNEGNV
jgi:hypothetical protein